MPKWSSQSPQLVQLGDVVGRCPEDAKPINDVVGYELGVRIAGAAVMVVVVSLTRPDVVGEGRWHSAASVGAVTLDEVDDVIADHAAKPPQLVALVGYVVADVRGCTDADLDGGRVSSGVGGRCSHRLDRPFEYLRIGKLKDVAICMFADGSQRFWSVPGTPDRKVPPVLDPRDPEAFPRVLHLTAGNETSDDLHRLGQRGEVRGFLADVAERRIAAPDAADGAALEHVVERCQQRGENGLVPRSRVRHHRPHDHVRSVGQYQPEDHERLLPQHVRVEGPAVREAVVLSEFGEIDEPARGRIRLQHNPEVHGSPAPWSSHVAGTRGRRHGGSGPANGL